MSLEDVSCGDRLGGENVRGKFLGGGIFVFILGLILAAAGAVVNAAGATEALYASGGIFLFIGLITAIYGGAAKPPTRYR